MWIGILGYCHYKIYSVNILFLLPFLCILDSFMGLLRQRLKHILIYFEVTFWKHLSNCLPPAVYENASFPASLASYIWKLNVSFLSNFFWKLQKATELDWGRIKSCFEYGKLLKVRYMYIKSQRWMRIFEKLHRLVNRDWNHKNM